MLLGKCRLACPGEILYLSRYSLLLESEKTNDTTQTIPPNTDINRSYRSYVPEKIASLEELQD